MQLAKEIGVTQKKAWFMLQRIRDACGKNDLGPGGMLGDIVETDEVYIDGKESNKHESKKLRAGRRTVGKITHRDFCANESIVKRLACKPFVCFEWYRCSLVRQPLGQPHA